MHVPKLLKEELGGGKKEFNLADGEFQDSQFIWFWLKKNKL